jgi:hypothetical protein
MCLAARNCGLANGKLMGPACKPENIRPEHMLLFIMGLLVIDEQLAGIRLRPVRPPSGLAIRCTIPASASETATSWSFHPGLLLRQVLHITCSTVESCTKHDLYQ